MAVETARQRWMFCWVLALSGVGISVLVGDAFRRADERKLQADFERRTGEYARAIEHEFADGLAAVESAAEVFVAMERVTQGEFRRATAHLLERHDSLRAIGWNPRVPAAERAAYEAEVRRSGSSGFHLTERAPDGELVRAGRRPDHVVVQYIEPLRGNEAAIGFDVGSEPRRRAALERAAATGEVSLTSQISLVQLANGSGLLAFWPVYHHRAAFDSTASIDQVEGFAVGVFEVSTIFERVARAAGSAGMVVRVDDVTDPDVVEVLHVSRPQDTDTSAGELAARFSHVAKLELGGRSWQLESVPGSSAIAEQRSFVPTFVLLVGLGITALLTAYLISMIRSNMGLEREIARRRKAERERRHLDGKLREAQKLESLGVLAGGIAHDFNNLLAGILGNTELALADLPPDSQVREDLEEVLQAAVCAADLTGQMLAYTGSKPFSPELFDLSRLIDEMSNLLAASVSKSAELRCEFPPQPLWIEGEPAQIRQIIMNLITNASEALHDDSGVIQVRTGTRHFDREDLADAYLDQTPGPGEQVFMEVSDEGCGMTPDQRARLFDPFFSTKFTGRGLGLAAVLGIVRSHRGAIWVESEPGQGSKLTVAFPAARSAEREDVEAPPGATEASGTGTLLVVDDVEAVRRAAVGALTRLGYRVVTAATGKEAVEVFHEHADEIRAVLLDATMPGMSGADAFRAMRRLRPDAKVLLSSGYAGDDLPKDFAGEPVDAFLAKPYTHTELARTLERVLRS